jgi:hypothetical protein
MNDDEQEQDETEGPDYIADARREEERQAAFRRMREEYHKRTEAERVHGRRAQPRHEPFVELPGGNGDRFYTDVVPTPASDYEAEDEGDAIPYDNWDGFGDTFGPNHRRRGDRGWDIPG